jgi:4'-phosphopantetheinyl transferase EntD
MPTRFECPDARDLVIIEARGDVPEAALLPEEAAVLGNVTDKRRADFTAGRHCARIALGALGFPSTPILVGPSRMPVWPPELVGSISHCSGCCVVAVGRRRHFLTIGIDVEMNHPLPDGVVDIVALEEERRCLGALRRDSVCWDCVLFSAKESVYKAWFPITRRWLGFEDAIVRLTPDRRSFQAQVLIPGPVVDGRVLTTFTGMFDVTGDRVLTFVAVPRQRSTDSLALFQIP